MTLYENYYYNNKKTIRYRVNCNEPLSEHESEYTETCCPKPKR